MTDLNESATGQGAADHNSAGPGGRGGGRSRSREDVRSAGDVGQAVAEREQADERAREAVLAQATALLTGAVLPSTNGSGQRDALVSAARGRLIQELRHLDREDGRKRLEEAATAGGHAVTATVQGVGALVTSVLPAAAEDPAQLVDTAFGLAELGLQTLHRLIRDVVVILRLGPLVPVSGAR